MKILAVGGGSGGHVTPVAAVLNEIVRKQPDVELRVWTDRSFHAQTLRTMEQVSSDVRVDTVFSGKFRRYHGLSLFAQLIRIRSIVLPNIRDSLYIGIGFFQSVAKFIAWRPDVVFCKGGYVCLPVGVAAHLFSIPIVLHDSDVHPGLANRVLSRWAMTIATGMPTKYYKYPSKKMHYVGVPINASYRRYTDDEKTTFKQALGFSGTRPLVVVTGGGLGSETLNTATIAVANELVEITNVLLISGKKHFDDITRANPSSDESAFKVVDFVYENMVEVLAAADIVVTRAGATTLLELAALAKPIILIPSPYLTGGHQLKNAQLYTDSHAATVIDEHQLVHQPHELLDTINAMLLNPQQLEVMSESIHEFARPNAAEAMADTILETVKSPTA